MGYDNLSTSLNILLLHNLHASWEPAEIEEMLSEVAIMRQALEEIGHKVIPIALWDDNLAELLVPYPPEEFVVLNWSDGLPGLPHSYHVIPDTLEGLGFAYSGAPATVLSLNEDKHYLKRMLDGLDLPTPHWRIFDGDRLDGWELFPAIVKPAWEHCSMGIDPDSVVTNPTELKRQIAYILEVFKQPAIVEEFIDGREFPVWLWGNGTLEMLPLLEWDFSKYPDIHQRLLTFEAKFHPEKLDIPIIPAELETWQAAQIEDIAHRAYRAMGCRDYGRLDVRLRDGELFILDVNTNPDISAFNSLAAATQLAKISYGEFGHRLVKYAWERRRMPALT